MRGTAKSHDNELNTGSGEELEFIMRCPSFISRKLPLSFFLRTNKEQRHSLLKFSNFIRDNARRRRKHQRNSNFNTLVEKRMLYLWGKKVLGTMRKETLGE